MNANTLQTQSIKVSTTEKKPKIPHSPILAPKYATIIRRC